MSRMVLQLNFSIIKENAKSWNEIEVYESLKLQIVDQFGLSPEKIQLTSRIIADLGID